MWARNSCSFDSYPLHQKAFLLKSTPTVKVEIDCDVQSKHLHLLLDFFLKQILPVLLLKYGHLFDTVDLACLLTICLLTI